MARPRRIISQATRVDGRRCRIRAPIDGNRTTVARKPIVIRFGASTKRRSPLAPMRTMASASPIAATARIVASRRRRRARPDDASADSASTVEERARSGADIGAESTTPDSALAEVALDGDHVLELLDAAEDARELAHRCHLEGGPDDRRVVRPDRDVGREDVDLRLGHDLGDVAEEPGAVVGLDPDRDRVGLLRGGLPLDVDEPRDLA